MLRHVYVKLDASLLDEVKLFCVVFLVIKDVAKLQLERLQFNHNRDQKVRLLVFEVVDSFNDLAMGAGNHLRPE